MANENTLPPGTPVIEVRVTGRGSVRAGHKTVDPRTRAICDLCGVPSDVVVSVSAGPGGLFACKNCLRGRLEAITVATWELRDAGDAKAATGLPWGKLSG